MLVSTKGRYALRFLLDLAQHKDDGPIPLKDIAERQGISKKYLERIVTQLGPSGMLKITRGYQGGYQLVRDPSLVSVAEVLTYTEGGFMPVPVEEYEANDITAYAWQKLEGAITRCLENITLQEIIDHYEEQTAQGQPVTGADGTSDHEGSAPATDGGAAPAATDSARA
ncbi:MAG: Rrf2 family transcriptional regulator [Coriobacteriales bacterium]|jgi:Rrf2 family protein